MLILLRLLMFGILAIVLWKVVVLIRAHLLKPSTSLMCETCRHCEMIDRDGVMCRYGDTVTLKTIAHVHMCQDFEAEVRPSRRR